MSEKGKREISEALAQASKSTLRESLRAVGVTVQDTADKHELIGQYVQAVVRKANTQFVNELLSADQKVVCAKLFGVPVDKVADTVANQDIENLLEKADHATLASFCHALSLEPPGSEMAKMIADEVMLTGMENFLQGLPQENLSKHCKELGIAAARTDSSSLVEAFMVEVFQLEPHAAPEQLPMVAEAKEEKNRPSSHKKKKSDAVSSKKRRSSGGKSKGKNSHKSEDKGKSKHKSKSKDKDDDDDKKKAKAKEEKKKKEKEKEKEKEKRRKRRRRNRPFRS
eukprot:TRINITY_DN1253_c0_g1_i3.p1 TRINITY_DN1253_c0_g1~~TRINITY_DN1253_c0_g1_i3.p1  ORF type:complete len:283 (-),score=109.27 TRINITY_DN1253_c0_g1_i3:7-855(-)